MNKPTLSGLGFQGSRLGNRHDVNVAAIFTVLWHGKWLIIFSVILATLLGGFYASRIAPIYRSTALVALESAQQQIVDFQSVSPGFSGNYAAINTEIGVMLSRRLVGKLVDRLELVQDPEFNPAIRPPQETLLQPILRSAVGGVRGVIDAVLVKLGFPDEEAATSQEPLLTERDRTISAIQGILTVQNTPNSYLFTIAALTQDPRKSAALANALAEIYVLDQVEVKAEAMERATQWLSERIVVLRAELEKSMNELNQFRSETQVASTESLTMVDGELKSLRGRARTLEADLAEHQAQLAAMEEAAASSDPASMAAAAAGTGLDGILQRVESGELSVEAFEAQFRRAIAVMEQNRDRAASQLDAVREAVAAKSAQLEEQSADLIRLTEFERKVEADRLIYEYFLQRMKEVSVQEGIQNSDSRILSYAVPSPARVSPRRGLLLALSAMIGLLGGSGIVIVQASRQQGVRSASELEATTGHNVLAQIPLAPTGRRMSMIDYLTNEPASAMAESVRNLRTSLLISSPDGPPQVVLVTSAVPGDGKSVLTLALAQTFVGLGTRVLVMDCDVRRHGLSDNFSSQSRPGVVSVLTQRAELDEAIFRTETGFDVLLGEDLETTTANPADVLSSDWTREIIKSLRERYDTILIDTPPVLAVPDAEILARSADAIVFAVRWNATPMAQVVAAVRSLERKNLNILGFALTQVDPTTVRRYDKGIYSSYGSPYGTYRKVPDRAEG